MKNLGFRLISLLFMILSLNARGQTITGSFGAPTTATQIKGVTVTDKGIQLPVIKTFTPTLKWVLRYDSVANKFQVWDGISWNDLVGGAGAFDSTTIYSILNQKTFSDTIRILVSGQSNANGVNDGAYDSLPNPKVLGWNTFTRVWDTLTRGISPLGLYTPTSASSPTYINATSFFFYFAKRLQEKTGKIIKVINLSWNAQSINNWYGESSTNFAYIKNELALIGNPKIDYFLWCQGETDIAMSDTAYKVRVDSLQAQLDRLPSWTSSTPFIIITPSTVTSAQNHIVNIQRAIAGSGLYDRRYTLVDASQYPGIDAYHFTPLSHYLIANKIMDKIYNKPEGEYLKTSATEITNMATDIPRIGKGMSVYDTTKNNTMYRMDSSGVFGAMVGFNSPLNGYIPYYLNGHYSTSPIYKKSTDSLGIYTTTPRGKVDFFTNSVALGNNTKYTIFTGSAQGSSFNSLGINPSDQPSRPLLFNYISDIWQIQNFNAISGRFDLLSYSGSRGAKMTLSTWGTNNGAATGWLMDSLRHIHIGTSVDPTGYTPYQFEVTGTGKFSDTLNITTMGTLDSSDRAASTAWVKRQGYGGGGGGGGSMVYPGTGIAISTGSAWGTSIVPSSNVTSILNAADYAAIRSLLGVTTLPSYTGNDGKVLGLTTGALAWVTNGLSGMTSGRIPVANSSTSVIDYSNLLFDGTYATIGKGINLTDGTNGLFIGMRGTDANRYTNNVMGFEAGLSNTTGYYNVALGQQALRTNTTGVGNMAIGRQALYSTSGTGNVAIGSEALSSMGAASLNVAIGYQAGIFNLTGGNNTYIGAAAGYNATGSSNVFIGNQSGYSETGSNKLYIANLPSDYLIKGDFSAHTLDLKAIIALSQVPSTYSTGGYDALVRNQTTGNIEKTTIATSTLQQVLTAGSTLTTDNIIYPGSHYLDISTTNGGFHYSDNNGYWYSGVDVSHYAEIQFQSSNSSTASNYAQLHSRYGATQNYLTVYPDFADITAPIVKVNSGADTLATKRYVDSLTPIRVINDQYVDASNVSTTETNLLSYTMPANTLVNNGDRLVIEAMFTTVANGNSKSMKFYFGTTPYDWTSSTIANGATIFLRITIFKTGSNTQRLQIERITGFSDYPIYAADTQTDTGSIVIKFSGTGAASNDITQRTMTVTKYKAP